VSGGKVDVLAVALFETYSRNSGNPPDCHYDRNAAEQWMAQALFEVGVAELIEALKLAVRQNSHDMQMTGDELRQCEAALARIGGAK
jgi:hypothetical protein